MDKVKDLCLLLGVEPDDDMPVIKSAFLKKIFTYHPDKNPDNPKAEKLFHQFSEALAVLTDEKEKTDYDNLLKALKRRELENRQLDANHKKLKDDLEAQEKAASENRSSEEALVGARLKTEIERLQKEGQNQMEEEQERIPLLPKNKIDSQVKAPQGLGAIEFLRFPHMGEAIFDQLNTQSLVECRRVGRTWFTDLDQQKFFTIRKILTDIEKFHKVKKEWNIFLRGANTEMVNRLGQAIRTSLMGNGRKQILPITDIFKECMAENYTELASMASTLKGPITQEMFNSALASITMEEDIGNTPRRGFWTQTQAFLMELADKLPRVIIIGGNGTGKTAMLEAFAARKASEKPNENVIFVIQQYCPSARPLLQLNLEVHYEKLKNVILTKSKNVENFNNTYFINSTICIDEIFMNDVRPEDLHNIKSKNLWVVIRDTRNGNPEEYLRNQFPNWVIVNLNYPLRTYKTVSEKVKTGRNGDFLHNNNSNASLHVASNMPIGPEPLILPRSVGSYGIRSYKARRKLRWQKRIETEKKLKINIKTKKVVMSSL